MEFNKELISERLNKLEEVKLKLKEKFVGIDNIIDLFIDNVKIWYVAPELQLKPLIINLWGMTGVGKTDLVRTFVDLIGFNKKFVEIQMDNFNKKNPWNDNGIQSKLEYVFDDNDTNGILLLDEMQRARTINSIGEELSKEETDSYSEIWTLLSDGKFLNDYTKLDQLNSLIYDIFTDYSKSLIDDKNKSNYGKFNNLVPYFKNNSESTGKCVNDEDRKEFGINYWTAKRSKKLLKIDETVQNIMMWNIKDLIQEIISVIDLNDTYVGDNYSKLLIIISGNLDEAYKMSYDSDDNDVDADIYHEFSKKITLIDIKTALAKRFKPEQIARFGNIHLIYPSLDKKSYYDIIKKRCNLINDTIKSKIDINFNFDKSIFDAIYRNGVFPTQGVRPVFSTISSFIECNIPQFIFNAINSNVKDLTLYYNNDYIYSYINNDKIEYKLNNFIDRIKKSKSIDKESLIAVHEIGHAISYMELLNNIPLQLICNTSSSTINGFIMSHITNDTKEIIINKIIISLSGLIAEEIIFGDQKTTTGSVNDIMVATEQASNYIRLYSMGEYLGQYINDMIDDKPSYGIIDNSTNIKIDNILKMCKEKAIKIITSKLPLLKELSLKLLESKKLENNEIYDIAKKYYPNINMNDSSHIIIDNYHELLLNKLKDIN